MTDNSYNNWTSLNDKALSQQIGAFIRQQRLDQNKSQSSLAKEAAISRSTLSLLEKGETVTLSTLIQVLRVLDQLQFMQFFVIKNTMSPLALLKQQKETRQRASGKSKGTNPKTNW